MERVVRATPGRGELVGVISWQIAGESPFVRQVADQQALFLCENRKWKDDQLCDRTIQVERE